MPTTFRATSAKDADVAWPNHEAKVRALLANPKTKRATRVHRLMLKNGRKFNPEIVAEELTQREAYELEAELIR